VRSRPALAFLLVVLFGTLGFAAPAQASTPARVAIIVGPVGEELTPVYLGLAEAAATAAQAVGAEVATAYSPSATAENVLAAVEGANVVVYFGHGVGSPNPYGPSNPATTNGWGLNGPSARGTHADSWRDGTLAYYGEAWIAEHANPAPGWVMIYSNACYAPGASEGFDTPATEEIARERVSAYSRAPLAEMGASAYFATDFFEGAAALLTTMLTDPGRPFGEVFAAEPRFVADGLSRAPHPSVEGAETWLHRSAYFEGREDYWYAFAGDPSASLLDASGSAAEAGSAAATTTAVAFGSLEPVDGVVTGMASSYAEQRGWEGQPTVALPVEMGGGLPDGEPRYVMVCADHCVVLPVVDSCPCYVGTADQRVANLSHAAWRMVSDMPLEEGIIEVEVHLEPPATIDGRSEPGRLGDS
jgi:hypothetical protein